MIDLVEANKELAALSAVERVKWAYENFGEGIVSTTSGGDTSAVTPHVIQAALGSTFRPKIIFCDTGYSPPETQKMVEWLTEHNNVVVYLPTLTPAEIEQQYPGWREHAGSEAFETVSALCKQEPLNRAFDEVKPELWIRGIMGWESPERASADLLEYREGMYRLHPILDWTWEQSEAYIKDNGLPRNLEHYDVFKGDDQSLECSIDGAGRVVFSQR